MHTRNLLKTYPNIAKFTKNDTFLSPKSDIFEEKNPPEATCMLAQGLGFDIEILVCLIGYWFYIESLLCLIGSWFGIESLLCLIAFFLMPGTSIDKSYLI